MRVIINWTETVSHMATIEVDPKAIHAYYGEEFDIVLVDDRDDWAIKNFLRDQRELWLDQVYADGSNARITNLNHTLDEINVIA